MFSFEPQSFSESVVVSVVKAGAVFMSSVALRSQRPYGLLGTGRAQDGHLDFHTAPAVG